MKKYILSLLMLGLFVLSPEANAQTVADVGEKLIEMVKESYKLFYAISYIIGLVLSIMGILKLKESNESRGQTKLAVPIFMLIGGALFIGLPSFVNMGIETFGFDKAGGNGGQVFKY